jgi:erythritol transport system permease protein
MNTPIAKLLGRQSHGAGYSPVMLLMSLRTFIALIAVFVYFACTAPNFLYIGTLLIVVKHVAINAFLAIGMTFVILTAGIDLSVGSIVGLAGIVAGGLLSQGLLVAPLGIIVFPNVIETCLITLLVGAFVGLFNGILVTRFRVAPFIATLGTLYIARGAALLISDGATFPNLVGRAELDNTGFPFLGAGTILGIPFSIWALAVIGGVAAYVAGRTPFGRQVYAVGGNERATVLSGIRVDRVKVIVYVISGLCAAFAGLVVSSELVAAHPASGETFELNAIAAAVLGGTSLAGGRGTVGGTVIGAFVIGVLSDGLVMLGVSSFWQMVIKGAVIITAVVLDQIQRQMQRRLALQAQMGH